MSFCSSPASQRSSFSSTYSVDCTSPNTAVTTPSSSGATSPKLGQSYTSYTQPPSPDALDFSYPYNSASPIPMNEHLPSSASPSYAYSCGNQIPSPSPYTYNTTPSPLPASPNNYGYPGYTANYIPESPLLLPSSYVHHLRSHTPPPMGSSSSSSMGGRGGSGVAAAAPRKYSGYPPASAFYGPMPNSPADSGSSSSSRYRRKPSEPINPEEYKSESWYTADGTKVECSAMHLQCATM